jgi:predicted regulator of Ras-like GTPase activity (Roadblock/LC7/MglB family)
MPTRKKSQVEAFEQAGWTPRDEAKERSQDLRSILDKIKTKNGVIGYILRAATSATVDIKDPSKIIDYAVLSTSALEAAESLSEAFGLGRLNNIVIKGKELKVLLIVLNEQRISIFMEKNVDHHSICKELPL